MSYVELLFHAVVRTYKSENTLPDDDRVKFLYQNIWGIITNKGGKQYRINSMSDHVHILFAMPPTIALSDFMKTIKTSSSKIIKNNETIAKGNKENTNIKNIFLWNHLRHSIQTS